MAQDIDIKIKVDSSDANQGLQQIGKNLDAVAESTQGAVNDLRKGLDGVEQSAKKASKALPAVSASSGKVGAGASAAGKNTDKLSESLDKNASSAGEAASVMGGFAGALSIVSPRMGAIASGAGAMASGLEAALKASKGMSLAGVGLGTVLGGVGVAVAAVALVWRKWNSELNEATAKMDAAADKAAKLAAIAGRVKPTRAERALKLAVLQGEADVKELEAFKAKQIAARENHDFRLNAAKELTAANQKLSQAQSEVAQATKTVNTDLSATDRVLSALGREGPALFPTAQAMTAAKEIEGLTEKVEALGYKRDIAASKLQGVIAREEEEAAVIQLITKLEKERDAAAKKKAETDKDANKSSGRRKQIEADRLKRLLEMANALKALEAAQRSAFVEGLEGEEAINEKYKDRVSALKEIAGQHIKNDAIRVALEGAQHETEKNRLKEIEDLRATQRENALAATKEHRQKRADAHAEDMAEALSFRTAMASGLRDLSGNTADLMNQLSENIGGTNKEQARALFNVAKGLTIAKIGFATAEGLIQGAAKGPPLGVIQIGAVMAQSAASLAMVAAQKPSFHTGSSFVNATGQRRELNAKLRAGEAVSTPLGAEIIGRSNIERANAGMGGGGGDRPVVFQYEHRMFSRFIRDNVRMRGPVSTELNRGKHTGHRG